MHIQREQIHDIPPRARRRQGPVLGGPSVSACPRYYPEFDYLHVGEMGDATDALIAALDASVAAGRAGRASRPGSGCELSEFPMPAYELIDARPVLMGTVQFSSGCPYDCEFCDIPGLYGRKPRLKTPQQIIAELDKHARPRLRDAVYFVDDNFIGNRRAVSELLPHLIEWQKRNGYPMTFACEATLNIAKRPEVLALMREAAVRRPVLRHRDPGARRAQGDGQGAEPDRCRSEVDRDPQRSRHGGGRGHHPRAGHRHPRDRSRIIDFVETSQIPMLTINLLQALPQTPLWDRLGARAAGRRRDRESNVAFLLPYDEVVAMWRDCMAKAYEPQALFERFRHQLEATYAKRLNPPRKVTGRDNLSGAAVISRLALVPAVIVRPTAGRSCGSPAAALRRATSSGVRRRRGGLPPDQVPRGSRCAASRTPRSTRAS